ncbi:hypothetical protein CALCODRAFT_505035 [Calocera cornea HHB12733]|uniref:Uncharacterized protein n=1 Tax=Calocera cornea HHB12733 TaxID=1353952 RepID=A0A165C1V1_9BASI|nr:hypothetical protein CALCODRAFT_505035 [Calocera cornea HHB12733]
MSTYGQSPGVAEVSALGEEKRLGGKWKMGGAQAREAEAVSLDLLATLSRPRYMDQKNTSTRIRPA